MATTEEVFILRDKLADTIQEELNGWSEYPEKEVVLATAERILREGWLPT